MTFAESNPPTLIRTSRLSSDYIRKNLDTINVPIRLKTDESFGQVRNAWTDEEIKNERRLVALSIVREGFTTFNIKFTALAPDSPARNNQNLIISCIRWEEKNDMVVTSVDIILVLETLVGEPFSVEEKSRIRRNLQFLKPSTVARSTSRRLFTSLMAMENPRPRNIEKDVKVFRWTNFFDALNKVLSKYSANPAIFGLNAKTQPLPEFYAPTMQPPATHYVPLAYEMDGDPRPTTHAPYTSAFPVQGNSFTSLPWHVAGQTKDLSFRKPRPRPGRSSSCDLEFQQTQRTISGPNALGPLPLAAAVF